MNEKFTQAMFDTETKAIQFKTNDGRILVRSGGSLCWRTNNCGNLASPTENGVPAPKKTKNYIGFAKVQNPEEHYFFIFPTYEAGREQLHLSIARKHAERTIPELMEKYAPSHENNTQRYTDFVIQKTGLCSTIKINEMKPSDIDSIIDAIEQMEGYHNNKETRKEVWVTVSEISTSDGASPIAGAVIKVQKGDQVSVVAADKLGRFPPLPHPYKGEPALEVHVPKMDGTWQKLMSITHQSKPKTGIFLLDALTVTASTLSHKAPPNAKNIKIPVHYRVKPGDTLSKIASTHKTTVDDLKKINRLSSDAIYPEQMLWIHSKGAFTPEPKTAVKPRAAKPVKPAKNPETEKKTPSLSENYLTWLRPIQADLARSKDGEGAPLALFDPADRRAPWMQVAVEEAKKWAGKDEKEITKTSNYHRMVSDNDLAGGKHAVLDKDGKPILNKDGTPKMATRWDGPPTLAGDSNAWCASFVYFCLKKTGYPIAYKFTAAISIKQEPTLFVKIGKPIYGAIRYTPRDGGSGHVCFVYGKRGKDLIVLGGNQNNQILFETPGHKYDKHECFYVPIAYKTFADKYLEKGLEEVDVEKIKAEFGKACAISSSKESSQG